MNSSSRGSCPSPAQAPVRRSNPQWFFMFSLLFEVRVFAACERMAGRMACVGQPSANMENHSVKPACVFFVDYSTFSYFHFSLSPFSCNCAGFVLVFFPHPLLLWLHPIFILFYLIFWFSFSHHFDKIHCMCLPFFFIFFSFFFSFLPNLFLFTALEHGR